MRRAVVLRRLALSAAVTAAACAPASEAPAPRVESGSEPEPEEVVSGGEDRTGATTPGRPDRMSVVAPEAVAVDPEGLERVDSLVVGAIAGGVAPGIALAVGRRGRLVRSQGYGRLDWRAGYGMVTDSTLYDLASLTKVVGTTTAAMLLVDEGRLDLDAPLSRYLPAWGGSEWKTRVTVRHLLSHTAGLPPFRPLWQSIEGRKAYLRHIAGMDLEYEPGTRTVYSDLGVMLTAFAVERITGRRLNDFLHERVFEPLGMDDTGFSPLQTRWRPSGCDAGRAACTEALLARTAPTERDTVFRGAHLHGVVHDENAFAMGGVAGHAGLFSSARDLAVFAQMLMNGGEYDGTRIVRSETVDAFTRRQTAGETRALGWDTPGERSSAGDYFSVRSFGHTGFTGTSLWIDREREVFVVLLTNRVNPTRDNHRHVEFRRALHDAVQRAITDMPVRPRNAAGE